MEAMTLGTEGPVSAATFSKPFSEALAWGKCSGSKG